MNTYDRRPTTLSRAAAASMTQKEEAPGLLKTLFVWFAILLIGSVTGGIFGANFITPVIADADRQINKPELNPHEDASNLQSDIQAIEQEFDRLKSLVDAFPTADQSTSSPSSRSADSLNELLIDAQKRSLDARAIFVAVQSVVAKGGDLKPYRLRLQPVDQFGDDSNLLDIAKQHLIRSGKEEDVLQELIASVNAVKASRDQLVAQVESIQARVNSLNSAPIAVDEAFEEHDEKPSPELTIRSLSPSNISIEIVAPKQAVSVLLGSLAGIVVSAIFVGGIRFLYRRLHTADDLKQGVEPPLLAEIPVIEQLPDKGLDGVMTFARPDSLDSRPFRNLRSAITFSSRATQRLLVTSPESGDGKTTTAVNLALSFAQANRNTLLIDADVRCAGTTQVLDLLGRRGLTQILRDTKPVTESCLENVFNMGIDNFDVLPAGLLSEDPLRLLSGDRFHLILSWAKASYDQIVIDGPTLSQSDDLQALGRLTDCAVIVIRKGTSRKLVRRAVEICHATGIQILGMATNRLFAGRKPAAGTTDTPTFFDIDDSRDRVNADRRAAV